MEPAQTLLLRDLDSKADIYNMDLGIFHPDPKHKNMQKVVLYLCSIIIILIK